MMIGNDPNSFALTCLRLRFRCVAITTIQLGGLRAGSNLRGALLGVMRRAACLGDQSDPEHVAACPVCWLAAAQDHPGQERRGYAIAPPLEIGQALQPGTLFAFYITLFGEAARYLPYFVLAVPEAGRTGLGPGRGKFGLRSIQAEHPLDEDWPVLTEGDNVVYPPPHSIDHFAIARAAAIFISRLEAESARVRLDFLTPLRIILDERLLKSPDFGAIFNHILRRADEIAMQHSGGLGRPLEERQRLWALANRVRLVESQTHWEEVPSGSSRTGQQTWISGMVGSAWYSASLEVWKELTPWLYWGEYIQVGKDTAKGNGVYRLRVG